MKQLAVYITALVFSTSCYADAASHRAAVERLMLVTKTQALVDNMYGQMDHMTGAMIQNMGLKKEHHPAAERFTKKMAAAIRKDLGWEKFKEPMIDIYVKHYTEEEINGLIEFYQSPLGTKLIEKAPQVLNESALITQKMLVDYMPHIEAMAEEFAKEISEPDAKAPAE